MIYLTSITIIVCLMLVVTTLGRHITVLLPSSFRESVGFYIAPLLGLAGIVLIATVYGWLSPFTTSISISLSVGLLLLGITFEKQRIDLFRNWLIVSAFAIVATLPILAPVIRFDSFNPFNDAFTYLVHGQWLQEHAFSEVARASGFFPAESQVVLYQRAGHRMGASFFLGFVQSLFHLEWSYYAYLPTVGFVFALGSLALGGVIRQVIPVSRNVGLALCILPAFTMNGFLYGAQFGFFPQTFGLAFSAGFACLVPGLTGYILESKPTWTKQFFNLLPLAIICSALLISYNDMFPVVGAGTGLFLLLVCSLYWSEKNRIIVAVLTLVFQVFTVVNVEGIRIIRNFVHTLLDTASGTVRFGWPVLWSPIQFVAHSFGMKSSFDSNIFLLDRIISIWVFPILMIAIAAVLLQILRKRPRNLVILFLICINLVFWLAFLKFRYATPGFDGEVGGTFLQFKLSKWLAPFNLGLLGIVIAWLLINAERYQRFCTYVILTVLAIGVAYFHFKFVAQSFTQQFQNETMRKNSPFSVLLDLRSRVAAIPKDQVIYVGIPNQHQKLTQMVAYILLDRKLASHYDDVYFLSSLPASDINMPIGSADWMIQLKPQPTIDENPLNRVGPFFIHQAPFSFYNLESITGAYGMETSDEKTWNWVKDSVEYRFNSVGKTQEAKVKFQFFVSGKPRTLFLELGTNSGKLIASFEIPMLGGWGEYESPAIATNSEGIVIRLKADGEPVRLSAGDSREAKFLIQNLAFDSVTPSSNNPQYDQAKSSYFNKLESITGAYPTETADENTWNWVKESAEYRFKATGKPHKSRVKFQFLLSGRTPRTLFLDIKSATGQQIVSYKIPMMGGWGEYESQVIDNTSEDIVISFKADGEPAPLSADDPRETKFLIKNLSLETAL